MKNINNIIVVFILLFSASFNGNAQPDKGKMQRFREEKIKYFNEKLDLTDEESKLFWPVHEDQYNRMMRINEDEKNLLSYYNANSAAMSDDEINEVTNEFLKLQNDRTNLTMEYHKKYVEILGKRKTMKMYSLEREFRRYILETFQRGRHGQGQGSGRGGRNQQ